MALDRAFLGFALILILVLSLFAYFFYIWNFESEVFEDSKNTDNKYYDEFEEDYYTRNDDVEDVIIGGDRDFNGCLIPAGYSWNEEEKECVREWESGELRYQVNDFKSCVDAGYQIMKSNPR
jgi:hypothetical protein